MRPYGVRPGDRGCCPGHDLYPPDRYNNARSQRARARDLARSHRGARRRARQELRAALADT